jgi:hypothetical protein
VIKETKQHFSTKSGRLVNRLPRATHYCTFFRTLWSSKLSCHDVEMGNEQENRINAEERARFAAAAAARR